MNSIPLCITMPELTRIAIHKHFGYSIKTYFIEAIDSKLYVVLNDDSKVLVESLTKIPDDEFILKFKDDTDFLWSLARAKRDLMLEQSDWTQIPDAPVDQQAWAIYRQKLRDITKDFSDPRQITYPVPPQ